ncbi:MAG: galactose oxidase-like domain-containing protein [Gemmatimonadales bacterium]
MRKLALGGFVFVAAAACRDWLTLPGKMLQLLAPDPDIGGMWSPPFEIGIAAIHSIVLPTGKVLVFTFPRSAVGSEARLWDPATGNIENVSINNRQRDVFCGGHSHLADGRLFVSAGHEYKFAGEVGTAENDFFDPATGTFSEAAPLDAARWYPTTVELADGRVLVFGGECLTHESFDPATNTVTRLPSSVTKYLGFYPRLHLLPTGNLVFSNLRVIELFDPSANTWRAATTTLYGTRGESGISILLPGLTKLLRFGGRGTGGSTATAEIIDFAGPTPTVRYTGSMKNKRQWLNGVLLPDGKVLAIGGGGFGNFGGPVREAELFDPATETWTVMATQTAPRMYHSTAVLLPDGRVLSAGQNSSSSYQTTGEIYSPPYLFKGPRPTIAAAPSFVRYGQTFAVSTPDASKIESIAFIKPHSVTHSVNFDQRHLQLAFTATDGATLSVTAPPDGNHAPPGWYMLFILSDGVPSVASWVHISAAGSPPPPGPPPLPDNTPPAPALTTPADGSSTTNTTPRFAGTAGTAAGDSKPVIVKVYAGTGTAGTLVQALTTVRACEGPYSVDASSALAPGTYTVLAEQRDASRNTGFSAANTFTISAPAPDITPPTVTLATPTNGSSTSDARPTFSGSAGTAAGDLGSVTVKVYASTGTGGALVQTLSAPLGAGGSYTVDAASPLAVGLYTGQAEQSDASGNTGFSTANTFTVSAPEPDTKPPTVTLAAPADGSSTSDTRPTFSGTGGTAAGDLGSLTVKVYAGAGTGGTLVQALSATVGAGGSYSVDAASPLAVGLYTGRAEQSDASGNTGFSTAHTFTIVDPPPYAGMVMSDAPRAYWRLGEASGTVANDEMGVAPGAYQNGVVLGAPGVIAGDANTAARFDGSNDQVNMGDPASGSLDFGTEDFTVEFWLTTSRNVEQATISKQASGPYWQVTVTDDGSHVGGIRVKLFDGAVTRQVYGPAVRVDDGAWHHVAVVFDRDTGITIYVDGMAQATAGPIPGNLSNAASLLVGKATGYPYFRGDLDEVAVYARALPLDRIMTHYTAGRSQ